MKKAVIGCMAAIGVFVIIVVAVALFQTLFDSKDTDDKTQTQTMDETTTATTATTTATQTTQQYTMETDLREAATAGLIELEIRGCNSLDMVILIITSQTEDKLDIIISPGMVLESHSEGACCNAVVIQDGKITVEPYNTIGPVYIDVASMNMLLDMPADNETLAIGSFASGDLGKLLNLPDYYEQHFRIQQYAVWTITDNPGRNEYISMNPFGWGGEITETEINTIKNIFQLAGISTEDYRALRQAVYVELVDAVQAGLIEVSAAGTGYISSIEIRLTSSTEDRLEVTILPGTIFTSSAVGIQSMVVITQKVVLLDSYEVTEPFDIDAACANMELDAPEESNSLALSTAAPSEDLIKLLNISAFHAEKTRVKQFAIWTITDNPERDGYMGIATGFAIFGTGPSDDEMEKIRLLFEEAGIVTAEYKAFA